MAETIISKRCSKCKQIKPLSEFHKELANRDRHGRWCKICVYNYNKEYTQSDKCKIAMKLYYKSERGKAIYKRYRQSEKGRAYQKRYRQSEKGKVASRKHVMKYRETEKGKENHRQNAQIYYHHHPLRGKTHHAIGNAVATGKLPRPDSLPCHYCHKLAKEYHHWHGYEPEHWLDVVPVCLPCHSEHSHYAIALLPAGSK